ncbi:Vacuolar protein sorting-associated protein 8 [Cryomyces antarcticus]|nr:Vacuolar protein sorting-associated protein 8 [Cryomyces antarcticus]
MSSSGESDAGGENKDVQADELERAEDGRTSAEGDGSSRTADMLREERERQDDAEEGSRLRSSAALHGYGRTKSAESPNKDVPPEISLSPAPEGYGSPEGSMSIPDDTLSIQGSVLSSPGSGRPTSQFSSSRTYSGALRPFERRFQSKLSPSSLQSPRAVSPAFLAPHSRQSSLSSQLPQVEDEADTPQAPWEVVRWTKLRTVSGQVFSEAGKRNFGKPTCLAVSASIAIGTSKGLILIFDYHQTLKAIIGTGTKGRHILFTLLYTLANIL